MRDFFKYTFASLLALLIFLGLSIGGLVLLVISISSKDPAPSVKDKSVLEFDLTVDITDGQRGSRGNLGNALLSGTPDTIPLRMALNAIDRAAKDKRIVALYLHGEMESSSSAGYAALKEIREALQRFQATGKKIIAYGVDWSEPEYYLASVADTIAINPYGSFEINGLASNTAFYAGALKKFGIGVQVTRVGKYKAAVESFLLDKRSPESRQQTQTLLGDVWGEFLTTVSKDRKLTPTQLQNLTDNQAIVEAEDAVKQKLATKLAYEDEMISQLQQLGEKDDESFRKISLKSYARVAQQALEQERQSKNQIAVVYAEGEIVDGEGDADQVGGDRFAQQLREIQDDDDIKAVVIRVNSPGGSVVGSEVIQREVIQTRKKKPVVVSMGGVAASGGYWISTFSDRIFAQPNTITGSIGVFGLRPNVQKIANDNGISWDVVKTGRYADISSINRPRTPQELAIFQKSVDRIYNQFVTKVAESRKLPKAKVAEIAQGRVWSGKQALAIGLVDQLGGLKDAIQDAAQRAKLGDDWKLAEYPQSRGLQEELLRSLSSESFQKAKSKNLVFKELGKLQTEFTVLRGMNDPSEIYARLPFNFRLD
ncbi:signal peptide peptidase SppA [Phormidium sp. CLA17]|uniref:signal peptide peptidase SppA n=1 Tax=Leptolyngbya sp. Cla-17 TaxID=2803751 RepID=UPI0014916AAD|nr:signal peptide peptidase SppA [Leptolyngbya sp. Cla-17]MBM0743694.1 signal peptide peptidase SppA [Leptolyngbya sp. Cla-17]